MWASSHFYRLPPPRSAITDHRKIGRLPIGAPPPQQSQLLWSCSCCLLHVLGSVFAAAGMRGPTWVATRPFSSLPLSPMAAAAGRGAGCRCGGGGWVIFAAIAGSPRSPASQLKAAILSKPLFPSPSPPSLLPPSLPPLARDTQAGVSVHRLGEELCSSDGRAAKSPHSVQSSGETKRATVGWGCRLPTLWLFVGCCCAARVRRARCASCAGLQMLQVRRVFHLCGIARPR